MAEETLGYVELEWLCPHCGTRNGGTQRACARCGAAMPEKTQFQAPAAQQLMSEAEAQAATGGRGPDVHCYFCGARSAAGSEVCGRCGGNLAQGKARAAGAMLGEHRTGPVPDIVCSHCKTPNPADARICRACNAPLAAPAAPTAQGAQAAKPKSLVPMGILGCVTIAAIGLLVFLVMVFRTKDAAAVVAEVGWERAIAIMEQKPTKSSDWEDKIPKDAQRGSCSKKVRKTQSEPAEGAEKVCDKPKMVDQGNGTAKVVQNCEYKIYDQWCEFTRLEWQEVDRVVAKGEDLSPRWPEVRLRSGQREGKKSEDYKVVFKGESDRYTYSAKDAAELAKYPVGSRWALKVNSFGSVSEIAPAK
jgi:ribosomal protein L40E